MGITYKDAGVDIDAGNRLVDQIKNVVKETHREGVISDLGGFGGLFELAAHKYKQPILVSGTDGVGTKLKLAQQLNMHDTIGIDLVAMCVNDIIVQGAEPLFFLDYFATGKLDLATSTAVVTGIATGCKQSNAALIGGETAEMPGMYADGEYDLAGFAVGVVEKEQVITGAQVQTDDVLVGLHSSGVHSNGFSLVNKLLEQNSLDLTSTFGDSSIGETLLTPTQLYVKVILEIINQFPVHGLCHVTGGGLTENLPRVLPENNFAEIDLSSWQRLSIFDWIQETGDVSQEEMLRVFNCGIGMVVITNKEHAESVMQISAKHGIDSDIIGQVKSQQGAAHVTYR